MHQQYQHYSEANMYSENMPPSLGFRRISGHCPMLNGETLDAPFSCFAAAAPTWLASGE